MFQVQVESRFSATHRLRLADGRYESAHRHDWPVWVVVEGQATGPTGMLIDFHRLSAELERVIGPLRDADLNDLAELALVGPSAEHVARYIGLKMAAALPGGLRLARVTVGEAADCLASFLPDARG